MIDWRVETRTCACGETFKPSREGQRHCSAKCRDLAKKRLKRSGDRAQVLIEIPRSGDTATGDVPSGLADGSTMVWPDDRVDRPDHGSNPDGSTPGALHGDDYPISIDANGYPELPACLDRRPAKLAEAA